MRLPFVASWEEAVRNARVDRLQARATCPSVFPDGRPKAVNTSDRTLCGWANTNEIGSLFAILAETQSDHP